MQIKNWLNNLFAPKELLWAQVATWTLTDGGILGFNEFSYNKHSYYEIVKKGTNIYIVCGGYNPKKHQFYEIAVEKLQEIKKHYATN